jgi:D-arabinose 1-dehydrogenase-like Zn-dependent alcohol dehydrogenase
MSSRTFKDLLSEYSSHGDIQIKLVTGEKIHGTIEEIGEDVVLLSTGSDIRVVNMRTIVFVSPGIL